MGEQEIFDAVAQHILQQRCQSLDADGKCAYRGHGSTRCAVGALIQDHEYTPQMETLSVTGLITHSLLPRRLTVHLLLLEQLQRAHDNALKTGMDDWEEWMRTIASLRGLSARVLDEVSP